MPHASEDERDPIAARDVIISVSSLGEDVKIEAVLEAVPSIARHASKAVLYAIAIQQLHVNAVLDQVVDSLLAEGPISQIDAANRLNSHQNRQS